MPEPTPAEELRTAAATLRELAVEDELYTQTGGSDFGPMLPALARLVADWLNAVAAEMTSVDGTEYAYEEYASWTAAVATARAINAKETTR